MKFKIGQVEIGLNLTQMLNGNGIEMTIDAPLGELGLAAWVSWMPKAKSKLQVRVSVEEVDKDGGEIPF